MKETDDQDAWACLESLSVRVCYDIDLYGILDRYGIEAGSSEVMLEQLEELDPTACNRLLAESSEHEERSGIRNGTFRDMERLARVRWWAAMRELRTECSCKRYRISDAKSALQLADVPRFELIASEVAEFAQQVTEELNEIRKSVRAELRDHLAATSGSVSTDVRKMISENVTDMLSHPPEVSDMMFAADALRILKSDYDRQHDSV